MDEGIREESRDSFVHFYRSEQSTEPHVTVNSGRRITASASNTTPEKQVLSPFEQSKRELLKDPYFCSWSEKQVSRFLLKRLHDLSHYHKIPCSSSEISFSRGIWGSCSSNGHIIINFNVAILPERLRDYLFLHELVHTRVKEHNENFWQELDKFTDGKARDLEKEHNRYHLKITL